MVNDLIGGVSKDHFHWNKCSCPSPRLNPEITRTSLVLAIFVAMKSCCTSGSDIGKVSLYSPKGLMQCCPKKCWWLIHSYPSIALQNALFTSSFPSIVYADACLEKLEAGF